MFSGKAAREAIMASVRPSTTERDLKAIREKFERWMQMYRPGQPKGRPYATGDVQLGENGKEWVWDGLVWIQRPDPEPVPDPNAGTLSDTEYLNSKWSDEDT